MGDTPPEVKGLDVPLDGVGVRFSWRTFMRYVGPGWIMSLAFIDPGNIEADLQSGGFTGFSFVWVLLVAHIAGLVVQTFASRVGVVTGSGLARVCRENYPKPLTYFLWLMAELAIIASDVQEVVGSSIAMNLLFGWPLWQGVVVTGVATMLFVVVYTVRGLKCMEGIIMASIGVIFACFSFDFVASRPDVLALLSGLFIPSLPATAAETTQLVALVGSVVMPHNLFLHSAMIGKRHLNTSSWSQKAQAIKYFVYDAVCALSFSFLINLSLQGSFAQGFFSPICAANPSGPLGCDPTLVSNVAVGCDLLDCSCVTPAGLPGLCSQIGLSNAGNVLASVLPNHATILFGLGLLAAGQASTLSGTMAGQFVMEGFLELKLPFWTRMVVTRSIALIPAVAVSLMQSEFSAMNNLSQSLNILQSIQLPFALLPLLHFSRLDRVMGRFVVGKGRLAFAWLLACSLIGVNVYMLAQEWASLATPMKLVWASLGAVYAVFIIWILRDDLPIDVCCSKLTEEPVGCEYQALQSSS